MYVYLTKNEINIVNLTFSYTLTKAGKGARIDKTDVKDAFKNVPAKIDDLRLQGFQILDRQGFIF